VFRSLAALDAFDRRLFDRLTRQERRVVDRSLKRLSSSANRSVLWLTIAAAMAVFGGHRARRAALRGAVAIAITSGLVNLPLKYVARRDRPPLRRFGRPLPISMPGSFSFPSGHSASAFAFATGVGLEHPLMAVPIVPLASAVAYSRVHLRVHYPFDVLAGAAIGVGIGLLSGPVIRAVRRGWHSVTPVPESERPSTKELILVVSPSAGRSDKLVRAKKAIKAMGLRVAPEISVKDVALVPRLLQRHGPSPMVVAAGGDGTVGAVADAIVGTPAVLGILPLGTSNDFARSLRVPMHVEDAVRLLARGRIASVDAGRFTGEGQKPRHFVHAAAVGLNVAFARFATRADVRARLGRLTYAAAVALALRERPVFQCEMEWENRKEQASLVHLAVINAPVFGGFLDLRIPGSDPDDRTLDVIMIEHLPIRRLIRSALYPAVGLRRGIRGIRTLQVSRLTVRPSDPMDVTLDGEVAGKLPGIFEVVPSGLRVVTPAHFRDDYR
jgi:YegS/Rv2252/BmrU family lipid kinase